MSQPVFGALQSHLLLRRRNENEVALRLDACAIQRPEGLEHRDDVAGVVADTGRPEPVAITPDGQVRAGGKDRVEMRSECDRWPLARSLSDTADVQHLVGPNVREAELVQFGPDVETRMPSAQARLG